MARGHRVTYLTTPERVELIRQTGADVVVYRSTRPGDSDPAYRPPKSIAAGLLSFVAEAEAILPQWESALLADRPDLVAFDRMGFAGGLLARKHNITAVQLWPMLVSGPQWTWAGRFADDDPEWNAYLAHAAKLLADQGVPGDLLAPEVARHIAFLPRAFQPHESLFDDRYQFVGPCLSSRGQMWRPPHDLDGRDVVLITLGSLNNMDVGFYQRCFAAFAGTPWHVVMPIGQRFPVRRLGPVPPNFEVTRSVAQLDVLRHAKVFVSHAGLGGVLEAVSAGVPQVVLPRTPEQQANAARVAELGIGLDRPADLREAVAAVAQDRAVRQAVAELRLEIMASGGATRAADVIEECLSG